MSDAQAMNALRAKLELPGVDVLLIAEALRGYDVPAGVTVGEAANFILSVWLKES